MLPRSEHYYLVYRAGVLTDGGEGWCAVRELLRVRGALAVFTRPILAARHCERLGLGWVLTGCEDLVYLLVEAREDGPGGRPLAPGSLGAGRDHAGMDAGGLLEWLEDLRREEGLTRVVFDPGPGKRAPASVRVDDLLREAAGAGGCPRR